MVYVLYFALVIEILKVEIDQVMPEIFEVKDK